MRPLLFLKWFDLVGQILALVITTIVMIDDGSLLAGWVALGAAQVLSCGANFFGLQRQYRNKSRRAYEGLIVIFLVAGMPYLFHTTRFLAYILHSVTGSICYAFILASPILAIWYFVITITEINKIQRNEDATPA